MIGEKVQLNDYVNIAAVKNVKTGENILIVSKVFISDHSHGFYGHKGIHTSPLIAPVKRELTFAPVAIEDDVWIGEFSAILPGVTIGKGSIIGTMSVGTKSVPPYSIAVEFPAKVVNKYKFDSKVWEQT